MNPKPLLSFHHIIARYGAIIALHDVSVHIHEGEIVTLVGANGAGKTTLLMSLFSQPRISGGEILFEGNPIHRLPTHDIAKLGISLSPEGRRVFPKMTVEENILLGIAHQPKLKTRTALKEIYDLFPILGERKSQRAGTLSGGEQQMLAMGRSLIAKPKLFLLDEPSLGLAPQITRHIFKILKQINEQGTTIFLVEQNALAALNLAHRGYVLTNGQVTLEGSGQELLQNRLIQSAYLGHE